MMMAALGVVAVTVAPTRTRLARIANKRETKLKMPPEADSHQFVAESEGDKGF